MLEVLLADDDEDVRESVGAALRHAGHRVTEAHDGADAAARLSGQVFDLAICDVRMPRLDGHALLRRIRRESPTTTVVMMTSFALVPDVVASLREGAVNYLTKPFDVDALITNIVDPIAERRAITKRFENARAQFVARSTGVTFVAGSPETSRLVGRITTLAASDASLLVSGDRGTGKKLVARMLHAESARRDGPLVVVEGSGLEQLMAAAALQALSGERSPRDAWFGAAREGTLVIDGIGRLSLRAQAELLRVVDEPATRARRGPSWEPLGVRLIALSSDGLSERVAAGDFLDALYYRINTVHLRVPNLRERGDDLCPLVAELLRELAPAGARSPGITAAAWNAIRRHEFKGNVRELRCTLDRALAISDGREIDVTHLPPEMLGSEG